MYLVQKIFSPGVFSVLWTCFILHLIVIQLGAFAQTNSNSNSNSTNSSASLFEWQQDKVQSDSELKQNDTNQVKITINKCCPPDHVVELDVQHPRIWNCVPAGKNNASWTPFFYREWDENGKPRFAQIVNASLSYEFVGNELSCNGSKVKIQTPSINAKRSKRAQIRVTQEGKIYTRSSGNHKWQERKHRNNQSDTFCIDGLLENSSTLEFQFKSYHYNEENQIVMYCDDTTKDAHRATVSIVHVVMMTVCSVFLFILVVVYVLIWDKQNIHGWTVATYSFSVLVFLSFKVASDCLRDDTMKGGGGSVKPGSGGCFAIGVIIHYFFISTFSWTTVVSYDLWATIGSIASIQTYRSENLQFLYYVLFGFGIPLIVVCTALCIEFNYGFFDDTVIRPQYGYSKCNLDKSAQLHYEFIPNTTLFALSICMSIFTLKFLLDYMRRLKQLLESKMTNKRANLYNQRAMLVGKLFILLLFSWVFEIAGLIWSFSVLKTNRWHVILYDIHNLIQSVGFFKMFVCKSTIEKQLRNKYTVFEKVFAQIYKQLGKDSQTVKKRWTRSSITSFRVSFGQYSMDHGVSNFPGGVRSYP